MVISARKSDILHFFKKNSVLLLLLTTTFFLEIYYALKTSLWVDEFFSWAIIQRPISDLFFLKEFSRWYMNSFPPLYEMLIHSYLKILSLENQLILRLPTILFFLLFLFLVYRLTFTISKNRDAALLAAFFTAFTPAYFFYGHMLRGCIFFTLLVILSIFFIHSFLKSHYKIKYLILLSLVYSAMVYTFYTSWIIIAIEILFMRCYVARSKDEKVVPYIWLSSLLPIIIFIPWVPNFILDFRIEQFKIIETGPFIKDIQSIFSNVLFKGNVTFFLHGMLFPISLIGLQRRYRSEDKSRLAPIILLASIFLYYMAACFFIMIKTGNHSGPLHIRYFLPVFFIAFIINSVFVFFQRRTWRFIALSLLVIVTFCDMHSNVYHPRKSSLPDIKGVASYLKSYPLGSQRTLIFFEDIMVIPGFLYYFKGPSEAHLATVPFFGSPRRINKRLIKENILVVGNAVGAQYFIFDKVLRRTRYALDHRLILVDTVYFQNIRFRNREVKGRENFIDLTEQLMEEKGLRYKMVEKRVFSGFIVAVYKRWSTPEKGKEETNLSPEAVAL